MDRQYRQQHGELDIVARCDDYTVFVEVKYRRNNDYGRPMEAVGAVKRRRVKQMALSYISEKNIVQGGFRFDVIEVLGEIENPEIIHIENAFW